MVASNDDGGGDLDSLLTRCPGRRRLLRDGRGLPRALPADPFDSGSGDGAGSEGAYDVTFGLDADDVDFYAVNLRAGDVLGAAR